MDLLVNRLYRTRLQFGYPLEDNQTDQHAQNKQAQYAYGGKDAAEISPLAIVFYTSASDDEGKFKDLSKEFSASPFAKFLDDYSQKAKILLQAKARDNSFTTIQTIETNMQSKQSLPFDHTKEQVNQLHLLSKSVKAAYFPSANIDGLYSQYTINYLV